MMFKYWRFSRVLMPYLTLGSYLRLSLASVKGTVANSGSEEITGKVWKLVNVY